MTGRPSYHDLYVTTAEIPRTRLFDLPYGLEVICRPVVTCNRVAGWELWQTHSDIRKWKLLAGEYDGPDKWLLLDVAGHTIVDSRPRYLPDGDDLGRPTLSHRHPLEGPGWSQHEHPGGPHWHDPVSLLQVPIREGDNG